MHVSVYKDLNLWNKSNWNLGKAIMPLENYEWFKIDKKCETHSNLRTPVIKQSTGPILDETTASAMTHLPFLLLLFSFLQFLQIFLSELDNVSSLLLGGQEGGGKRAGAPVERLTVGGARQILPQILADRLALQEFGPEDNIDRSNDLRGPKQVSYFTNPVHSQCCC